MLLLIYNYQIGLLCSHLLHSSTLLLTSYEWDVNLHVHISISLEIEIISLHLYIVQNMNLLNTGLVHTI